VVFGEHRKGCLHDPASVQQTSSKCIQNTRANAGRLLDCVTVISKVFEHCILDRFADYFITSDNQFGFKRNSGCSFALYTLRSVVDYYVKYGSTVNICSIDLSKAFDKMDRHALFIQLMRRNIPVLLVKLLETWFDLGVTCVKWGSYFSEFVKLSCGIRQRRGSLPLSLCCFH